MPQPRTAVDRAQDGRIPAESFIETLIGSEVFMPVYEKHQIGGLQTQELAQPLKLVDAEGAEALVLFTSPERAKDFVKDHPGFGGGLVADFAWILEKLGVGYAIMLNPGLDYGMDFEAQDVAQLFRPG
ncbi:SseB family protein [Thiocystis violacea]|uniref:SseB family protein n=1 Tax=Thiocystis violacea TaxID=13725 RepID=UPI0019061BF5|nr:SseB family protein [Thiocystis violacea]MBK1720480.1 SseB protein [Thiocystis violacea]